VLLRNLADEEDSPLAGVCRCAQSSQWGDQIACGRPVRMRSVGRFVPICEERPLWRVTRRLFHDDMRKMADRARRMCRIFNGRDFQSPFFGWFVLEMRIVAVGGCDSAATPCSLAKNGRSG